MSRGLGGEEPRAELGKMELGKIELGRAEREREEWPDRSIDGSRDERIGEDLALLGISGISGPTEYTRIYKRSRLAFRLRSFFRLGIGAGDESRGNGVGRQRA